jgi:hypothetical protein
MPAGPPPAIQHLTETVLASIATSMWWREDEAEKGYSFMEIATSGLGAGSLSAAVTHTRRMLKKSVQQGRSR